MAAFTVLAGTTQTNTIELEADDTLLVEAGTFPPPPAAGILSVNGDPAIEFTDPTNGAVITNNGTIESIGDRAIRFLDDVGPSLTATINNNATGIIQSDDDAIQLQEVVTSGLVTINNTGVITSVDGRVVSFGDGGGTFVTSITNLGVMASGNDDAIEAGGTLTVVNSCTINGGNSAGHSGNHDGVSFEDAAGGTVTNNTGGAISGDRHAINAGENTSIAVVNNVGAIIHGRNGSGVGSDGSGSVVNFGTIIGAFSGLPATDANSPGPLGEDVPDGIPDGDGDGVDFDGQAVVLNHGIIAGTGAGGNGSDGLPNTSDGIAAGGGIITNFAGATISGAGRGIVIDDSSQGNAPFQTTITNLGTITGTDGFAIQIVSTFADLIVNRGTIAGGDGTAILFGNGNNTLRLGTNSVIDGTTDGEGGTNTLDYTIFGVTGVTVNLTTGVAAGTGGVLNFQNVTGSGRADVLVGNAVDNILSGRGGQDDLNGRAGDDTLNGGTGMDTLRGANGDDTLNGGAGRDLLIGGDGEDVFVFDVAPTNASRDAIIGFSVPDDVVNLDNAVFTQVGADGGLDNVRFFVGAAAHDGNDRIIYNDATGALIYDANGDLAGGAVTFAILGTGLTLTSADFIVV